VIGVTTQNVEYEESYREQTGLDQVLLYEGRAGQGGTAPYKGHPCPRLFRVDAERRVTWIGPSPNEVPNMEYMANMLLNELGFRTKYDNAKERREAPPMPPELSTLGKPPMPPMPTAVPAPAPPPTGDGHSADDGHGH
jgi:hypothetical protein